MIQLLCRNRVADFDQWWSVFQSHAGAHRASGLFLVSLWRDAADPDNVFFLFDVEDQERAKAFLGDSGAAEARKESGVLEGEFHFVSPSESEGY